MATLLTSLWSSKRRIDLYTFGSPRVGNRDFVDRIGASAIFRYVDCRDYVTRVPFQIMGYEHAGSCLYIDRAGKIASDQAQEVMDHDRWVATEEYLRDNFLKSGTAGSRGLADHAPINYVSAVMGIRG